MNTVAKWLAQIVGLHFSSFPCLPLSKDMILVMMCKMMEEEEKDRKGASIQSLDHRNWGNHNLPSSSHQLLNASEDADPPFSQHFSSRVRKEVSQNPRIAGKKCKVIIDLG